MKFFLFFIDNIKIIKGEKMVQPATNLTVQNQGSQRQPQRVISCFQKCGRVIKERCGRLFNCLQGGGDDGVPSVNHYLQGIEAGSAGNGHLSNYVVETEESGTEVSPITNNKYVVMSDQKNNVTEIIERIKTLNIALTNSNNQEEISYYTMLKQEIQGP